MDQREDALHCLARRHDERRERLVGEPRDAALGGHPQHALAVDLRGQHDRSRQALGLAVMAAAGGRERVRPLVLPIQTLPSGVSAVARAIGMSVSGVTRCGVSRCSPACVPTQTLPSRSSNTHCTASVASPCWRVRKSTVGLAVLVGAGAPQPLAARGHPEIAAAIVQQLHAPAALRRAARAAWRRHGGSPRGSR